MGQDSSTCWGLLQAAAAGEELARAEFAARYVPVVRAYLAARWRGTPWWLGELDDAVQEVFLECLKDGGLLERAQADRPGGFRPFLYGAARNVALRVETRQGRQRQFQAQVPFARESSESLDLQNLPGRDEALSRVFDRAWARSVMRQAAERQRERAEQSGEAARQRVELLRLRFHEGMPIREIAQLWGRDATFLHREYARARHEFKSALRDVLVFHGPGSSEDLDRECAQLLALLE